MDNIDKNTDSGHYNRNGVILLLLTQVCTSACSKVSIHYEANPSAELDSLRCVTENMEFSRTVVFNQQAALCERVSANVTATEDGHVLMKMTSYEIPFEQGIYITVNITQNFDVGCRIDVIFKTPDVIDQKFSFRVVSDTTDTTFIHVMFKPNMDVTLIRSKRAGTWSTDVITPNPITSPNTVYKASLKMYSTHWNVEVNDDVLLSYNHVYHPLSKDAFIRFGSDNVLCQRIVFYPP